MDKSPFFFLLKEGAGWEAEVERFFSLFLYRSNTRPHSAGTGFPQLQIYGVVLIMFRTFFPLLTL